MSLETKTTLNESTIKQLQGLIQTNIDSRESLQELAEKTDEVSISTMFGELAAQRSQQAAELQRLVETNCEEAKDDGSYAGAARRTLIDIRAALGGGTKVMLIEAEKCEDTIKEQYEDALKDEPGSAVSDVLHQHLTAVKAAHDRVRDMRDAYQDS